MKKVFSILIQIALLLSVSIGVKAQSFQCTGEYYLVINLSPKVTQFYRITQNGDEFKYDLVSTISDRWITGLSFHPLDGYIYGLDYDSHELIKFNSDGSIESLGVPENLDNQYTYSSGMILPDGSTYQLFAFNPATNKDDQVFSLNMSRNNFYAGFFGVTGERPVAIQDMIVHPVNGLFYGYDNNLEKIVELGIGGSVATFVYPNETQGKMHAMFSSPDGQMLLYSAEGGMYEADILTGKLKLLKGGPKGIDADGCSCPYTYEFTKTIEPREIAPCEPFEVTYTYTNHQGMGQTWLDFRDTFPDGFEIIDIRSEIVSDFNIIPTESNVIALENIIYLIGENTITLKVMAGADYSGAFSSQATNWDFPKAFGEYQYSDDPMTTMLNDETSATILAPENLQLSVEYSCERDMAIISSPIQGTYQWSTGSVESVLRVTVPGTYSLKAESECATYEGEITIAAFPEMNVLDIVTDKMELGLGDEISLEAVYLSDNVEKIEWYRNGESLSCTNCKEVRDAPLITSTYEARVTDDEGCMLQASLVIRVKENINTYVPNTFSPNGDGINDDFVINSSLGGMIDQFAIYDRWGGRLFSRSNVPLEKELNLWDGRVSSQKLKSNTYVWLLEITFDNGTKQLLKGQVLLLND